MADPTRTYAKAGALRSQYEVARLLGISRARVKQLEQSGLRKLRDGLSDWAPPGKATGGSG